MTYYIRQSIYLISCLYYYCILANPNLPNIDLFELFFIVIIIWQINITNSNEVNRPHIIKNINFHGEVFWYTENNAN